MKGIKLAACAALLTVPVIGGAQAPSPTGCESVNFGAEVTTAFPRVRDACQAIMMKGDQPFVKLTGELVSANSETATVHFLDRNNKPVSEIVFAVREDARIDLDGRSTRVARLPRGTRVNFYIQHNRWGLFANPDSTPLTILSRKDL